MRNNFTIKINNVTIHYNDTGSSDVPLVFIHGFPFNRTSWYGQQNFFKSHRRVITYDIRGFGDSSNDFDTQLSMSVFAHDFIHFLDALKIEKAVVCGLSMGGYILMNAFKTAPERFAAIVLCDTQCNADSAEAKEKRYKTIEEIKTNGLKKFADDFVKNVFHENSFRDKKEKVEEIRQVILQTSQQTIIESLKALAGRTETCSVLELIKVPTLIICGNKDKVTPPEKSEVIHKAIKHSTYLTIDKAGHLSNIDQPEEFNKQLGEFLKAL